MWKPSPDLLLLVWIWNFVRVQILCLWLTLSQHERGCLWEQQRAAASLQPSPKCVIKGCWLCCSSRDYSNPTIWITVDIQAIERVCWWICQFLFSLNTFWQKYLQKYAHTAERDALKAAFVLCFSQQKQNKTHKSWNVWVFSAQKRQHAYQEGQKSASSLCDAASTVTMAPHTCCATILHPPSSSHSSITIKVVLIVPPWRRFAFSLWSFGFCPRLGDQTEGSAPPPPTPRRRNHGIKNTSHTPPLIQPMEMFAVVESVCEY